MARTFEVLRKKYPRWVEVAPGDVEPGDVVRVKDSGTVVSAADPEAADDPQAYFVFSGGTTSPVADTDSGGVKVGVTILHPDGDLGVIPLVTP